MPNNEAEAPEETIIDKIKNYVFPAKKVLENVAKPTTPAAPSTDTSYIQKIVNQRMKEKLTPKNPLVDALNKPGAKKLN